MLDRLEAKHFTPLVDQPYQLTLPDGHVLAVRIDSVREQPLARMPDAPAERRLPFLVTLTALEPTDFVDGLCALELPELGCVRDIWIGRMAALGRDHAGAYFQIAFN
ncbi:hypothetical protein [Rhodanobacter sp. T12-5]|jgi:hypothetical protein|uniref:DUF6916 family protein n=1 Tax=Rhodanobacter sp. T12-5 TaxID=2024611 RepID=UPI0011ECA4E2|nr:hypothetical protein [Rhodanobacter sp. T12-5]KAA0069864.1 hypothetical protein CIW53_11105 [Rhodanobacter sp. T12-5]